MSFTVIDEYPGNAASPTGSPGCFTCGAPKRHPHEFLIDLGTDTDQVKDLDGEVHGFKRPILCENCVRELITLIGGMEPEKAARLTQTQLAQAETIEQQAVRIAEFEDLQKIAQRIAS